MPFEFKSKERKHPSEYGGSPHKALLEEISDFAKQHRHHNFRRYAGMEDDEAAPDPEKPAGPEDCEACAKGDCDNPEHMSEEERSGLEKMLGGQHERPSDFEE